MNTHKCPACHLVFRYRTELEDHTRQEHLELSQMEETESGAEEDREGVNPWRLIRRPR